VSRVPDVGEEPRLRIGGGDLEKIRRHAEESCPLECCGVLVGVLTGVAAEVRRVVPVRNVHHDPEHRYEIPPDALLAVLEDARRDNEEIVGYYHSHPNRAAKPSAMDERDAWPQMSYLIVSTGPGGDGSVRSWRRDADRSLREEPLVVSNDLPDPVREIVGCPCPC
jgi:proteasome lid subunit RPN8/RPN11